jgi:signal transduction histidine kinase
VISLASYRFRLPLSLSVSAVATALFIALAIGAQTLTNLREDQGRNALSLGHALTGVMLQALRNDDVWLAYSLLRGPEGGGADSIWIVADAGGRIFASNQPRRYRLDQPLSEALPWLPQEGDLSSAASPGRVVPVAQDEVRRLLRLPLVVDDNRVGELVALLSDAPYLPRFREILLGGVLVTAGVLGVLLPLGWLWGRRMVTPLVQLADCMGRVSREDLQRLRCAVELDDSEIGQLGRRFSAMLAALAEKAELERQMVQAERLAAVGRVAAGVAHEVNNPLAGMLMAIDTYRGTRELDAPTRQLLDLLDRALQQIQGSIAALLVEGRADTRHLRPEDLDDLAILLQPRLIRSEAVMIWRGALSASTELPAAPVRQLLLNLLLNAIEATRVGGLVVLRIEDAAGELRLRVDNTGEPIPPERLAHLFEPYAPDRPQPQGLGLWVCYQIATQLGGSIRATVDEGATSLRVVLPLGQGGRS